MKQKRKVKNLLLQEESNRSVLITALLFILSLILCVWSASLLTMSVWAAEPETTDSRYIAYTWLDDNREVLYDMQFVDPENMENVVNKLYVSGYNLYITWNSVVVNKNKVSKDSNGNIFWWDNNSLNSNNVNIIAWENIVVSWSDNSVILWWNGNEIGNSDYTVVVWWKNNTGEQLESSALIWWDGNLSKYSKNVFILWWNGNSVISRNNVIIWWLWWIRVFSTGWNIFAFSNRGLSPKTSNAFYLDVENGVWINVPSSEWLAVKGAISVWYLSINVTVNQCDTGSLWVIWSWNGCLVGCTKKSMENGRWWELFDRWEECRKACLNDSYCSFNEKTEDVGENSEENFNDKDYDSFCTDYPDYATPCFSWSLQNYKNVVFETNLIDSNVSCPSLEWENKCVFKCNSWYHLTGDVAWWNSSRKECYSDCSFIYKNWPTVPLEHNQTIIWYSLPNQNCSYNISNGTITTCANRKQTFICNNWTVYIAKNWVATQNKAANNTYYENCELKEYNCPIWPKDFNLTKTSIESIDTDIQWNDVDRSITNWKRWVYRLCLDYKPVGWSNEQCSVAYEKVGGVYDKHYQLERCNDWYKTWVWFEYECKQQCKHNGVTVNHNQSYTFYKTDSETCEKTCEGEKFTCNDGSRENSDWKSIEDYQYAKCTLNPKTCEWFDVSQEEYNQRSKYWNYESCIRYNVNQNSCVKSETGYKLVECYQNYHIWDDNRYCISNYDKAECDDSWTPTNAIPIITDVTISRSDGKRSSPSSCKWKCNTWYDNTWTWCVSNECDIENLWCKDSSATSWEISNNTSGHVWYCESKKDNIRYCAKCNEGYYASGSEASGFVCMPNQDWKCGEGKYECFSWIKDNRNGSDDASGYSWECKWQWSWTSDEKCLLCNTGYHEEWGECVSYKCTWIPNHAVVVSWSDEWLTGDTQSKLYSNIAGAWSNKCAFICDVGYIKNGNVCQKQNPVDGICGTPGSGSRCTAWSLDNWVYKPGDVTWWQLYDSDWNLTDNYGWTNVAWFEWDCKWQNWGKDVTWCNSCAAWYINHYLYWCTRITYSFSCENEICNNDLYCSRDCKIALEEGNILCKNRNLVTSADSDTKCKWYTTYNWPIESEKVPYISWFTYEIYWEVWRQVTPSYKYRIISVQIPEAKKDSNWNYYLNQDLLRWPQDVCYDNTCTQNNFYWEVRS